jgi:hypothetical protein
MQLGEPWCPQRTPSTTDRAKQRAPHTRTHARAKRTHTQPRARTCAPRPHLHLPAGARQHALRLGGPHHIATVAPFAQLLRATARDSGPAGTAMDGLDGMDGMDGRHGNGWHAWPGASKGLVGGDVWGGFCGWGACGGEGAEGKRRMSVALACKRPLNARLETGADLRLSFFFSFEKAHGAGGQFHVASLHVHAVYKCTALVCAYLAHYSAPTCTGLPRPTPVHR